MTTILVTVVVLYAFLCIGVWARQDKLVWFPGPPPSSTPAEVGLAYDELRLATRDGVTIHGWFVPAREPKGAILVSHGNAGSVENRVDKARAFVELGWSVLLYDYRGYGASTGTPSEEGTYLDAETAYDELIRRGFDASRIVSFGESLGGAIAIELAVRRAVRAVIVEDTFTSLVDMAAEVYPWLPVRWLARIRYASIDKIASVRVPTLVIHSPEDDLVPFAQGRRLFEAAGGPKELLATSGGHNGGGFLLRAEWRAAVGAFLDRHAPTGAATNAPERK